MLVWLWKITNLERLKKYSKDRAIRLVLGTPARLTVEENVKAQCLKAPECSMVMFTNLLPDITYIYPETEIM